MPSPLRGVMAARRLRPPGRPRPRPGLEPLEPRCLLAGTGPIEPTADEQYMLQLINRARSNPPAEGQRVVALAQTDPVLQGAATAGELGAFVQVISSYGPRPPLAFDTRLIEAARNHSATMAALNSQVHAPPTYLVDPQIARASDGQAYYPVGHGSWATGENIFAYSQNVNRPAVEDYVDYYHAGFEIDWGNPDFGHLKNLMAPGPGGSAASGQYPFSEIGIGLVTNAVPGTPPPSGSGNQGLNVGPVIVTQEFGWRSGNAALTGAFYLDADKDRFYTPGEGLGSVVIRAVGRGGQGTFQVQTWGSGGYTLHLPPGTYDVSATGNLPTAQTTVITIGADNVLWDVAVNPAPRADQPVPGDYDADGKADVAVYRQSTGQWFLLNSRDGYQAVPWGMPGVDIPVPGQYDGPGRTEIAVYRPTTGQWFIVGPTGGRVVAFGAPNLDIPVPGEYDADGRTDLAVFRPTTAEWIILGSRVGFQAFQFGVPGLDVPVPGNYDGTGRVELGLFRPSTAQWIIAGPTGGRVIQFGVPGLDQPIPGDYDGDGKTDLALFRPGTAQWIIAGSRAGGQVLQFGAGNLDIPIPGHYDGLGKSQLAVYRPTTAQWIIIGANGGRVEQWGQGGASATLSASLRGSLVSSGGQTSRFGVPGASSGGPPAPPATPTLTESTPNRVIIPVTSTERPPPSPPGPRRLLDLARLRRVRVAQWPEHRAWTAWTARR